MVRDSPWGSRGGYWGAQGEMGMTRGGALGVRVGLGGSVGAHGGSFWVTRGVLGGDTALRVGSGVRGGSLRVPV